mgnify:FL=1|jgi:hypothetical protein|tara:strand:- start:481 stop:687 length:207 start_codon:yes stop_codon:yes gene_type:complete
MTDDGFELIGTIPRNETDVVKVRKGNYYKIDVIDIRWFKGDKISRKGIRLNREEATYLLNILRRELDD